MEGGGLFGLLDGVSPWWWVAFAILLGAVEMLTISTVLIWSALAALVTALALWVWPWMTTPAQITLFAVLSIAFSFIGRAFVGRWGEKADDNQQLNQRAAQIVGREAVVDSFAGDEGQVTVDGVPWPARLDAGATAPVPGSRVRITAVDGIVVRVTPV
jgi:membrane protein implicated in regulation of membrane protease activity